MEKLELDFLYWHPVYKDYGCDENGNVYSKKSGKIYKMSPSSNKKKYLQFNARHNGKEHLCRVNRFVWECIKGDIPAGYDVDHINFVRTDNRIVNLQTLPAKINRAKNKDENRRAITEKRRKALSVAVYQYTKDGYFYAEYPSAHEAYRQTGVSVSGIAACCRGDRPSAGGFIWSRFKVEKIQPVKIMKRNPKVSVNNGKKCSKKIVEYDLEGNFVKEYDSIMEASRQTGIAHAAISRCCCEKQNTAGRRIWRFA